MKRIINRMIYDSSKAKVIITIKTHQGPCKLMRTRKGNYFILTGTESDGNLIAMTKQEAIDFLSIHKEKMKEGRYSNIMMRCFRVDPNKPSLLPKAAHKIAETINLHPESIFWELDMNLHFIVRGDSVEMIDYMDALQWVEDHQDLLTRWSDFLYFNFLKIKPA